MWCAALCGLEFDSDAHLAWFSPEDGSTNEGTSGKRLLGARAQVEDNGRGIARVRSD